MKLSFIGADHEVTGSCHYMEVNKKNMLVDYGMEQGIDVLVNQDIPVSAADIDYVFLTHAHIDHTGLLPLLYAKGFRGQVFCTEATADLCNVMLRDSAHIQMAEAEWRNRKGKRSGAENFIPLYTMEDAMGVIQKFVPCPYNKKISICEGVEIRFTDIGHLLGSASIEFWLKEDEVEKKVVFSGDIGNSGQPLLRQPQTTDTADYVIMESTYGDRSHGEHPDYVHELAELIQTTMDRGGNLVIPSFAVGRTQELLYFIRIIKEENLVKGHDNFEVYVDSPLAIEATTIFNRNEDSCFDEEAIALVRKGVNPIGFPGLKSSITSDESKQINFDSKPKVIISASGMCEAGRIRHHLKHNLWRKECTILFVGYQAVGSLGRSLLEGAKTVHLFGEEITVHADIRRLNGISGHADQGGLIRWIQGFKEKPKRVFIVHGEDSVCDSFAALLKDTYGFDTAAPYSGACFDLAANAWIKEGLRIPIEKKKKDTGRVSDVFQRLLAAGQRLMAVIRHNEGGANKDLAKFADQINSLCDKWDR
jgi:metallo-beta-lactamase family protein